MKRLYLTDDQTALVVAALRSYSKELQSKFDNATDLEVAENVINIMNRLDDVLDIMTED